MLCEIGSVAWNQEILSHEMHLLWAADLTEIRVSVALLELLGWGLYTPKDEEEKDIWECLFLLSS